MLKRIKDEREKRKHWKEKNSFGLHAIFGDQQRPICEKLIGIDRTTKRLLHDQLTLDNTTPGYWSTLTSYHDQLKYYTDARSELWNGLYVLATQYESIVPSKEKYQA